MTETKEMNYSFFLGCIIPNRYPMIEKASRVVLKHMGINLIDMKGASCCPAPGVFRSVDNLMWLTVGARNITIAQDNKADLVTLCNGCYGTLLEVEHILKHNPETKSKINDVLKEVGREFDESVAVRHLMDVLINDYGMERLELLIKKKLGLRVAVHYGCHLLKPSQIRPFHSEVDNPRFFDKMVEMCGCTSVDYKDKFMCCGAGGAVRSTQKDSSLKFTVEKLRNMRKAQVDCIAVCCPFCHLQYDMGQIELRPFLEEDEEPFRTPVFFITQLLGLAMGFTPTELGMIKPENIDGLTPYIPLDNILEKIKRNQDQNPTS